MTTSFIRITGNVANIYYNFLLRIHISIDIIFFTFRNAHKASEPALAKDCDSKCQKDLLCRIVTADFKDQSHCERVSAALNPVEDK